MAAIVLRIVHEQHFIEGDSFLAFFVHPATGGCTLIGTANNETYLDMCERLEGLKWRLEQLGNEVVVYNKFDPDPNFETKADAEEYMRNKGE